MRPTSLRTNRFCLGPGLFVLGAFACGCEFVLGIESTSETSRGPGATGGATESGGSLAAGGAAAVAGLGGADRAGSAGFVVSSGGVWGVGSGAAGSGGAPGGTTAAGASGHAGLGGAGVGLGGAGVGLGGAGVGLGGAGVGLGGAGVGLGGASSGGVLAPTTQGGAAAASGGAGVGGSGASSGGAGSGGVFGAAGSGGFDTTWAGAGAGGLAAGSGGGELGGVAGGTGAGGVGGDAIDPSVLVPENRMFRAKGLWPERINWVCTTNADGAELTASELASRQALVWHIAELFNDHWQRVSDINVIGWDDCANGWTPLRLVLDPLVVSATEGGYPGAWQGRDVVLSTSASDAEILYLLGKAIGFGNEYDLERYPGPCQRCSGESECAGSDRNQCLPSGFCGRLADHESIMAPPDCGGIESIRKFTPWDIAGARRAYGPKPTGSLVSAAGSCVQVKPSGNAVVDVCLGDYYDTLVRRLGVAAGDSDLLASMLLPEERCLQAPLPAGVSDSTQVSYAPCNAASPEQDFRLSAVHLRATGGLCVAVSAVEAGAQLVTANCQALSDAVSIWTFRAGRLELGNTGLCAAVDSETPPWGAPIVLRECDPSGDRQTFRTLAGAIRYGDLCFNVSGGLPVPGARLVLWGGCAEGFENESFYLSGHVTTAAGQRCLELDRPSGLLSSSPCAASAAQEWDYYF